MGGDAILNKDGGFTLIECIITLAIFSIVLSLAMGLYLTGYKYTAAQKAKLKLRKMLGCDESYYADITLDRPFIENVSVENNVENSQL